MRHGTWRLHPPWYTLEGIGLVFGVNIIAFVAFMPALITLAIRALDLERSPLAGAALVGPYAVLQALAQVLVFLPLARWAKAHLKRHFARAVADSSAAIAIAAVALVLALAARLIRG